MRNDLSTNDVRDVLGMRSPAAWVLVGAYYALCLAMAMWNDQGVGRMWVVVLAALLASAGAIGVMYLPGDPLPHWAGALIAAVSPVVAFMVVTQLPVPTYNAQQTWFIGGTLAFLTFLCVRGAIGWAWVGLATRMAVFVGWYVVTGQNAFAGFSRTAIDFAPLLMATFFAYTVRPTAQSIFALRERSNSIAASEAASAAVLDERDAQLDSLDAIARPLLEVVASGRALTDAEQEDCRLLEARLRDRLRAGTLIDDDVADAAGAARRRGVAVVLLDDGGLDEAPRHVRDAAREAVRSALAQAKTGRVSARVLPPGRAICATILVNDGDSDFHIEIGNDGVVVSDRGSEARPGVFEEI